MNVLSLLSVTAAAAADQTCDLHLRWSDGSEERVNQNQTLALYTASAKQRMSGATDAPATNSAPWSAWFLGYADAYDNTHGEPPSGYVAPSAGPAQATLFPAGGAGVEVVTDPRELRRRALDEMGPGEYKAAAKAAGIQGFSRMKKSDLIEAVLKAEFDKPAEPQAQEPAPAPVEPTPAPAVVEPAPQAEPAPEAAPEKPKRARKAKKADEPAAETGGIVAQPEAPASAPEASAPAPGIQDGETRPEVATEGLGGAGVEMGGGMGLGGGTELGGGLGTGEGELSGGLTGESSTGIGGEGRDDTPTGIKHRAGAGCKQPDKVDGWEAGRVLVVVKPHRGEFKDWGTCEYRVRCEDDGTYTLIKFTGARKPTDVGNIFEGKHWDYVSQMLTDLMGIPRDPATGRPTHHHRMTLRRWFALGRAA